MTRVLQFLGRFLAEMADAMAVCPTEAALLGYPVGIVHDYWAVRLLEYERALGEDAITEESLR